MGETLSAKDAYAIGQAFGTLVLQAEPRGRVCVGRDGRLSSPELEGALVEGLLSTGAGVVSIGLGPTPMLYFAQKLMGAAGAIQVTGSHNPPDHNGFKMMLCNKPFFGEAIPTRTRWGSSRRPWPARGLTSGWPSTATATAWA